MHRYVVALDGTESLGSLTFAARVQPPAGDIGLPLKRVLFLCMGNACRSPMAEALAQHLAPDVMEASSAGLYPLGYIAAPTLAVLAENDIPCKGQTSKVLREADLYAADLIINMTGRPAKILFDDRSLPVEDWDVGDPFGSDLGTYRAIRDEIARRVTELAAHLRAADDAAAIRREPA